MRAEADSLEEAATAYLARAKQLRSVADAIDRLQQESSLPSTGDYATFATMATANVAETALRRGAPLESEGPIASAARKLGIGSADVARRLGVNPGTARNWDKRGRIPNDTIRAKLADLMKSAKAPKSSRS